MCPDGQSARGLWGTYEGAAIAGMKAFCTFRATPLVCAGVARNVRPEWSYTIFPFSIRLGANYSFVGLSGRVEPRRGERLTLKLFQLFANLLAMYTPIQLDLGSCQYSLF